MADRYAEEIVNPGDRASAFAHQMGVESFGILFSSNHPTSIVSDPVEMLSFCFSHSRKIL